MDPFTVVFLQKNLAKYAYLRQMAQVKDSKMSLMTKDQLFREEVSVVQIAKNSTG